MPSVATSAVAVLHRREAREPNETMHYAFKKKKERGVLPDRIDYAHHLLHIANGGVVQVGAEENNRAEA